jgi:hypothetical protein
MTIRREGKLRFRRSGQTALRLEPDVAVRLREGGTNDDRRFDVYDSSHIVVDEGIQGHVRQLLEGHRRVSRCYWGQSCRKVNENTTHGKRTARMKPITIPFITGPLLSFIDQKLKR